MKTLRKISAVLTSAAMLMSMLPTMAAAVQSSDPSDQLIYNCGTQEVLVVWEGEKDSGEPANAVFEEDGSYTIQLEDNAFFPYEVQFQYDGKTFVEQFDTPESSVTVGDHKIYVESDYDEDAISQIGVYIDGKYVPAKPEEKSFSQIMPLSLLPLDEYYVTLDLTNYTPEQLEQVEVSAILAGVGLQGTSVWWDYSSATGDQPEETFRPMGTEPVDLNGVYQLTMLVGNGNQLDTNNKRYTVRIDTTTVNPDLDFQLYSQDDEGQRTLESLFFYRSTEDGVRNYRINVSDKVPLKEDYYLNITANMDRGVSIEVYNGLYDTAQEAQDSGKEITSKIFNQSMETAGAGYLADYRQPQPFTLIYQLNGAITNVQKITVQAEQNTEGGYTEFLGVYTEQKNRRVWVLETENSVYDSSAQVERETIHIVLQSGFLKSRDYWIGFHYIDGDEKEDNSQVTKAVLGLYNDLDSATSQPDVKEQLLAKESELWGQGGYLTTLDQDLNFTIFVGEQVYQYTLTVMENPGSGDTYLNINGAEGISSGDIYKVVSKDDSGAQQFGYQILLVDDTSVNLANLKPTFTVFDGIEAFVDGRKQTSGESAQNFVNGPVQYTARAENGENIKNYWVTFAKTQPGQAKLFVVLDGNEPSQREVFFDGYTDYHHDIFLANLGDQTLTGLNVQLQNAQHVRIDEYWNVGGSGNDSLAGFDSATQIGDTMSNIAKIRLLPDGEGQVSGQLVISSDNGGSYTINLTGQAGDPSIITDTLDDGVKYVPYSFLIQTNNKYDWNEVRFSLEEGTLPEGMVLRPSGEIYGVPTEVGTFSFTVKAKNSSYDFTDSLKEFTLVILNNTDSNVASQVDDGYGILDEVPRTISTLQDYLFRSEGSFGEFQDFWLDGVKLVDGVDYDAKEGSTAITIRSQTFQKYGSGTHTIAAEFRVDGDTSKALKRTAQNYSLNLGSSSGNSGGSGNSSGESVTDELWNHLGSGQNTVGNSANSTVNAAQAVQQAFESANQQSLPIVFVRLKGVDFISLEDLQKMTAEALLQGKQMRLNIDTMSSLYRRSVDVRVSIDPSLATEGLYLAGSTTSDKAVRARKIFEKYFSNEFPAVVGLSQKGSFGQLAEICVKVPEGTDIESLRFYAYDYDNNIYSTIWNPSPWIDNNHYLHFYTTYAGDILISIGDLVLKTE